MGPGAFQHHLQAHLEAQLRFIRGNLARLDRSAARGCLTADESQELGFCGRMLGAVRPFKNAETDLQNAKLFWEVHDLLLAVEAKRGAEEDQRTDRVLNARFQSMGPGMR